MVFGLLAFLFLAALIAVFEDRLGDFKNYLYILFGIVLFFLTAFRPIGIDNDSENYVAYFRDYSNPLYETIVEFSFLWICKTFNQLFGDARSIFVFYALVGIGIKWIAFRKLSNTVFLVIVIYIGNYFIIHEFTQIRAAVASGLLLLAIKPLGDKKTWTALMLMCIAIVFHYSSVAMLPLLLLSNKTLSKTEKYFWALVIPVGYVMYFVNVSISSLPIPYFQDKLDTYEDLKDQGMFDEVNVFNLVFLVRIVIFYYLLYMYDTIKHYNKYATIMLKMLSLSLFCFPALSALPVLSFRVSEIYGIIEVILFTTIFYTIKPYWFGKVIVCIVGTTMFLINVFYTELIVTD